MYQKKSWLRVAERRCAAEGEVTVEINLSCSKGHPANYQPNAGFREVRYAELDQVSADVSETRVANRESSTPERDVDGSDNF